MSRVVAILTGSSNSGRSCFSKLLRSSATASGGLSLRPCFRSEERAAGFRVAEAVDAGADIRVGVDAADPASLRGALEGAHTAVLVTPLDHARGFGQDAAYSIAMVEAALHADVKRIVHVGSWTTKAPAEMPGLSARFAPTEAFLREEVCDRVEWAVLRGGYFLGNLVPLFGAAVRGGGGVAFPKVRVAPVDARDIGVAAAALCELPAAEFSAQYQGRFIECSGPEMLGFETVAAELSTALGREVPFQELDVEAWAEGKPPPLQELLRFMVLEQEAAVPFEGAEGTFARLLDGCRPTSLRQWVKEHAAAFQ